MSKHVSTLPRTATFLLAIVTRALLLPSMTHAGCEDGKSEGWEECEKHIACGGNCQPESVSCEGGRFYTRYNPTGACTQREELKKSPPVKDKERLFRDNCEGARAKLQEHWAELVKAVRERFGADLTDRDLRKAEGKISTATLVPPGQWDEKHDEGYTTPGGDIFIKDTDNQELRDTNRQLIEHEGVHSVLTGRGIPEEAEEQFVRDFIKSKWRR